MSRKKGRSARLRSDDVFVPNRVQDQLRRAAACTDPVLLTGETGTGKTCLARLIHDLSSRAHGPFIAVNCAALPDNLFEREMYGHVAGAFTDARVAAPGYFEAATAGTILLDEVAEMSLASQAKLLGVVETGRFSRLGSPTAIDTDARIVAATNADLAKLVADGRFRADLYYRLSVASIQLPPLRSRHDQLPRIVRVVLADLGCDPAEVLDEQTLDVLRRYHWPGNHRELQAALRTWLQSASDGDSARTLPAHVRRAAARPRTQGLAALGPGAERERILSALTQCSGHRARSAQLLGISRSTLWAKMRFLGLSDWRHESGVERPFRRPEPPRPASTRRAAVVPSGASGASSNDPRFPAPSAALALAGASLLRDLKHTLRRLVARPTAASLRLLVLVSSVALATTMFAFTDPFLLKPLPYPEADSLLAVTVRRSPGEGDPRVGDVPTVADWRRRIDLFSEVAAYQPSGTHRFVGTGGGDVVVRTAEVTERFFDLLGVLPHPVGSPKVDSGLLPLVLARDASRRAFGLQPDAEILGRMFPATAGSRIRVDGFLPADFVLPSRYTAFPIEAVIPVRDEDIRVVTAGLVLALPAKGIPASQLRDLLLSTLPTPALWRVEVVPLDGYMKQGSRAVAIGGLAAAFVLLLLCAASLANLQLAARLERRREFGLRRAIGASEVALARLRGVELATEAALGATFGAVLAFFIARWASVTMPEQYALLGQPAVDARACLFALVTAGAMVSLGLLPSLVSGLWCAQHRQQDAHDATAFWRLAGTATQVFIAGVLCLAAFWMTLSWRNIVSQSSGFDERAVVLTASYRPGHTGIALEQDINATVEVLQTIPGVDFAGAAIGSMLDRLIFPSSIRVRSGETVQAFSKQVTPSYFQAAGSGLVAGRFLQATDQGSGNVVVTAQLARQLGSVSQALGSTIGEAGAEIVGVVEDERNWALDQASPTVFSLMKSPWGECDESPCGQVSYVVRGSASPSSLRFLAESAIADQSIGVVIFESSSIEDRLRDTVRDRSFTWLVAAFFATTGLAVAILGTVGMVTFAVERQIREIGIRVAIGAPRLSILRLVLGQQLAMVLLGLAGAAAVSRLGSLGLRSMLYGVDPNSWQLVLACLAGLLLVALVAALIPARRALAVSPLEALRTD